jgi:hypothetical protein
MFPILFFVSRLSSPDHRSMPSQSYTERKRKDLRDRSLLFLVMSSSSHQPQHFAHLITA